MALNPIIYNIYFIYFIYIYIYRVFLSYYPKYLYEAFLILIFSNIYSLIYIFLVDFPVGAI